MRGTRIRGLMQAMLRVGVIGFGGGNALIPVMEKEFVTKKPYVTKEEYDEAVLAASITPGALPVEIACGIGRKYGRACMLLAASLVALPGAVATVALLAMMEHIDEQTIRWLSVFTKAVSLFLIYLLFRYICGIAHEAMQESRIGRIAEDIAGRKGVKFVMIAGPSSSGKTTFSHRLSIQLKTFGLTPHPIEVDNYFVNREKTPRDADGNYNFESLDAIDTERFNRDMCELLEGKRIELPTFNFKTGKREYKGNFLQLGADDILVIEGIHGLNDKMSYALPNESKYKIYISALTSLNVDEHNRISTADGRLLRRLVRDARTRGTSAGQTIAQWPSVRRGEEENIFPFQESADATFNSALIYELCVLKTYAEPLLYGIQKGDPEYFEAKRLLKFLDYFLGVSSENLPKNSIVREFVGGSCFRV